MKTITQLLNEWKIQKRIEENAHADKIAKESELMFALGGNPGNYFFVSDDNIITKFEIVRYSNGKMEMINEN